MSKATINRRQFLETGGRGVAGGVAASLLPALVVADDGWAAKLGAISQPNAEILLRMCRVLYPHDSLHDGYYAACVESLDAKAAADEDLAEQLRDGVTDLNDAAGGKFLEVDETKQIAALRAVESMPFFQAVRGHMIVALYTDRKVWSEFGYEGPSYPFGGYLERGFNDIDWLPES
jgi:hypothetical protein